jgi:short-subunit dehydrogenase
MFIEGVQMELKSRTALVTGASSGIGAVMATALAARGADVVLVARRADRLESLATRLRSEFGITASAISKDLAQDGAAADLAADLAGRGLTIDVLVNNAGFGTRATFVEEDEARISDEIMLNVKVLVELTRALLPGMVERDFGAVVNVASTAAFQPLPKMAVYGATKAFVLSFTEALWGELEGTGVKALTLCPGATDTEFFDVGPGASSSIGPRQSVEDVVSICLKALDKSSSPPTIIAGRRNALLAQSPRILSRRAMIRASRRVMAD